jgi:hypothetical protein
MSMLVDWFGEAMKLTLALHADPVNTRADDHNIVHDRETALASHPVALAVLQATVGQDSRLIKTHSSAVLGLGQREFLGVEELPY